MVLPAGRKAAVLRLTDPRAAYPRTVRRAAVLSGLLAMIVSWAAAADTMAAPASRVTGNLVVLLGHSGAASAAGRSAVSGLVERLGGRLAGRSVPQVGLITVRPPRGVSVGVFAEMLRSLPGVAVVQREHRYVPRFVPDDPALRERDPSSGMVWQWYLAREGFYRAWDFARGRRAVVGVIDTGIDARHPDLSAKIAAAVDQQDPSGSTGPAGTDQVGHGTDVASLACADTDNGIGMAGAGFECRLVVEKTDFSDSSVAAAIVDAADRGVGALNMSFGASSPSASGSAPASEIRALRYAAARKVVLVAAAADFPQTEQGDPANVLQPVGTAPDISKGMGLDVTAADYSGGRASFTGYGTEVSLAAFGVFDSNAGPQCGGPPKGIFGAFPGNPSELESSPDGGACRVALDGDSRYATFAGTSMAAPQVAATAAMMRALNPYATLPDILRILKQTAQRPVRAGWSRDLGWGILSAGAALDATRRLDRLPPVSRLIAPRLARHRTFTVGWYGHDQQRPGLIASGIAYYQLYVRANRSRPHLIARTSRHALKFRGQPGQQYRFYLIAVDRAGNRQLHPAQATTRIAPTAR